MLKERLPLVSLDNKQIKNHRCYSMVFKYNLFRSNCAATNSRNLTGSQDGFLIETVIRASGQTTFTLIILIILAAGADTWDFVLTNYLCYFTVPDLFKWLSANVAVADLRWSYTWRNRTISFYIEVVIEACAGITGHIGGCQFPVIAKFIPIEYLQLF